VPKLCTDLDLRASTFWYWEHIVNSLGKIISQRSAFAFRSPAQALAACLPCQDHIYKTTDKSFRFHNKIFDEVRCKLYSTENPRSFEEYPTPPSNNPEQTWAFLFEMLFNSFPIFNPNFSFSFVPILIVDKNVCNALQQWLCAWSWLSRKCPQTAYKPMTIVWRYFHTSFFTSRREGLKLLGLPVTLEHIFWTSIFPRILSHKTKKFFPKIDKKS